MKKVLRAILGVLKSYGIGVGLLLITVIVLLGGLSSTEKASSEEQIQMLKDNIYRAVVSCYALEGSYPESLEYLTEHYNVRGSYAESIEHFNELDGKKNDPESAKYVVHYMIFASNIMPDVDVMER